MIRIVVAVAAALPLWEIPHSRAIRKTLARPPNAVPQASLRQPQPV